MRSVREDELLDLVDRIYDAGMSFGSWPDTLARMADLLGAQDASLGATAPDTLPWVFAPRTDPEYMRTYAESYHPLNTVLHGVTRREIGRATSDAMVMPRAALEKSAFHNEWSRPQGYSTIMGCMILAEGGWSTVVMLPGREPFEESQLGLLEFLARHLRRAVQMNIRLVQGDLNSRSTAMLLEKAATAAFVIDADAHVLFANAAAETLFNAGDLPLSRSRLADPELRRLAARCARGAVEESGRVVSIPRIAAAPLRLEVTPVRRDLPLLCRGLPVALVLEAIDPASDPARLLRQRYGLTAAEAAFALEIVRGDGKPAAAERLGISYATARTHLSRIFEKTGVHRQAELVRLIMGYKASTEGD